MVFMPPPSTLSEVGGNGSAPGLIEKGERQVQMKRLPLADESGAARPPYQSDRHPIVVGDRLDPIQVRLPEGEKYPGLALAKKERIRTEGIRQVYVDADRLIGIADAPFG
jgi:hypothetical protein